MSENRLSTGLVIAGAYADKVRRTLFAQAKGLGVESREIVRASAELNRVLFEILVNKLKVDKGDVVRIRINYTVKDGQIEWLYDTLEIEAFKRIPDEEVMKIVKDAVGRIKEILGAPVSEEERSMVGAEAESVRKEALAGKEGVKVEFAEAKFLGENEEGEKIVALKNEKGRTIGVLAVKEEEDTSLVESVVITGPGEARIIKARVKGRISNLEDVEELKKVLARGEETSITKDEAKKLIEEKIKGLI